MNIITNMMVVKIKSGGLVLGLLFHTVVTNGYNMKSMENSGEILYSLSLKSMLCRKKMIACLGIIRNS